MRNVTNKKNLDARQSLYCVWIVANEQPNAPLVSVWIDRPCAPSSGSFKE